MPESPKEKIKETLFSIGHQGLYTSNDQKPELQKLINKKPAAHLCAAGQSLNPMRHSRANKKRNQHDTHVPKNKRKITIMRRFLPYHKYYTSAIVISVGAIPYLSLYILEKCDKFLNPTFIHTSDTLLCLHLSIS